MYTYQRVSFSLLEVVTPIKRIHPGLDEELGPVSITNHHTVCDQATVVLAHDELGIVSLEMRKCLDDAVGGYNWVILDHQALQLLGTRYLILERLGIVHNVRILIEEPEVLAVGIFRQGVAQGDNLGPRLGRTAGIVVVGFDDHGLIACNC